MCSCGSLKRSVLPSKGASRPKGRSPYYYFFVEEKPPFVDKQAVPTNENVKGPVFLVTCDTD